jgi:hypothetical protein
MRWNKTAKWMLVIVMALAPRPATAQDANKQRHEVIQKQLAQVRDEHAKITQTMLQLIEKHGTLVMSRDRVLQEMGSLEEQAWNSKIEREEAAIRSQVLRDRVAKMVASAKEAETKDEVASLLEKKLAIATSKRARVDALRKSGTAPESEVEDADALVTDAQLALAMHREQRKQSPETEEIKAISRELAEIESDSIVKEKLAEVYLKRAEELKSSLLKTAEYADLERTEQSLDRKREHWEQTLLQFETEELELAPAAGSKNDKDEEPKE